MRIISGIHKGRRLTAPKSLPVRPTTDLAKESLFNILNNRIDFEAINVLDLFAGTGNISFEFGSRGVQEITSVDSHYACIKFIEKTSEELSISITAIKADVFKFLTRSNQTFDIVFADPPYDLPIEKFIELVDLILINNLVKEDGIIILEHSKHMDLSFHSRFIESRRYGGSIFSFFE